MIQLAERSENQSSVLMIQNLDDRKNRLAKVVLMILIVKFFEHALEIDFDSSLAVLRWSGWPCI